ncbi:MAG TPA: RnfABCDGE type electron transport complex subunit D [Coleofasciculaceae cyanobacterium]
MAANSSCCAAKMPFTDARIYQILFLCLFLLVGIGTRDWSLQPGMIVVAIVTCLITQAIASAVIHFKAAAVGVAPSRWHALDVYPTLLKSLPQSLPSALITSLGLSLLLRTDRLSTLILAGVAAILSKFLLKVHDKHLFNPANFGIIVALTLTQNAWVSPGQWGEEGWYALLFLSTGGLVVGRVGRWETSATFWIAYAGLEAARNLWLGWTWDVWMHRLMSGSLLMFALFMITDPRTIPNARLGRIIWAIAIAALTFFLRNFFFLSTAPFWALFALAPLAVLLDRLFVGDRFVWHPPADSFAEEVLPGADQPVIMPANSTS